MPSEFKLDIKIEDHTEEVLEAMKDQLELGLKAVGESMEGHAKDGCPVRTGRLRDSIVYVTEKSHGSPGPKAQGKDGIPHGNAEKNEVQVGTNVEYAPSQEYGDNIRHRVGGAHFLRNAAANHHAEYKSILEAALKT
ncbi:MAG TPA: hypothetical protein DHV37_05735 [Erysipelotrichaceae bacterium]|nr:hypothetical protein [Erysipelotrichaceae bacterium]